MSPSLLLSLLLSAPPARAEAPLPAGGGEEGGVEEEAAAEEAAAEEAAAEEAVDLDARQRPLRWWRYPLALGEALAFNGALHLGTRYVFDFDWAHISWQTMTDPARRRWTFDDNVFATNAFGHPYQGAMYYSTARIHDLTYLESLPVVVLASWTWERFLETEPPSINDQITTSWSGPFVGEVLWRLSSQVLDERTTGRRRVLRELGAGLIDPIRGIDRLVTGQAWRTGAPRLRVPMHHQLALGVDLVEQAEDWRFGSRLHYELAYGDPLAHDRLTRPLDAFDVHLDVHDRSLRGGPGLSLYMDGALIGRRVDALGQPDSGFVGLYQATDFVQNRVFELGDTGLGPGGLLVHHVGGPWDLGIGGMLLFVPMGAVDSPYTQDVVGRDYVLGPGGSGQLRAGLSGAGIGQLYAEARATWIASASEPHGSERVGLTRTGFVVQLWRGAGLGGELEWHDRVSLYRDHPDFHRDFLAVMAHATLEL
ncbi:MAG: DUF3943 domain-containing protein [Alphaproteobacteria bacterium]|nr:DUF3943 domain-containing protein [Alphaproteobacteria bacterium]